MRLHRFYLQNENFETLTPGDSFICTYPETVKQMSLILRAKIGDIVCFFNNDKEWIFELTSISKKEVHCLAKKEVPKLVQKKTVFLLQSIVKKDKFEWIAQKTTELGVTDIIPIISERSEKKGLDEKRLEKIIIEATEQSGWGRVPKLHKTISLEESLKKLHTEKVSTYILDMDGKNKKNETKDSIAICIGPEGGWGIKDKEIFKKYAIDTISLGKSVLRAETAAIIGVYHFLQ